MKYFNEINNSYFLPINIERNINHELDNIKLPINFYDKYQILFNFILKVKYIFLHISLNNIQNDEHREKCIYMIKKFYKQLNENNQDVILDLNLAKVKQYIQYWGNVFEFIYDNLDNSICDKDYYLYIMSLFNQCLIDIGKIDGSLKKVILPNNWLITSNGYLYNTWSTVHLAGNYKHFFNEKIDWFLNTSEPFKDSNSYKKKIIVCPEFNNPAIINEQGFVSEDTLDSLLHYIDYYKFNGHIYDERIKKICLGMLYIGNDLIKYLRQLEKYTEDPKRELLKTLELTKNEYMDFLIRACGVSKITSCPHKTIITSSLNARDFFKEYLDNGWNVCFIPPIIINKNSRQIEELNMDSLIINSYIGKSIIFEDEYSNGKVYTNYLKYQ